MQIIDRLANWNPWIRNFDNSLITAVSIFIFIHFWNSRNYQLIGIVITIIGLALWWVAKLTLGQTYSLTPSAHSLVTRGIYSKLRHPIYIGSSMVFIGWAIFSLTWWLCVVALLHIIMQTIRLRREEKLLLKSYGNTYIHYKEKTWL